MASSARLRVADIRAVHRLVGECCDLGDSSGAWRARMFAGVSELAGAALGVEYQTAQSSYDGMSYRSLCSADWGWEGGFDRSGWDSMHAAFASQGREYSPMFRPYADAVLRGAGPALTRADLVPDRDWYRSRYYQDHHAPTGGDAMMYCILPMRYPGVVNGLFLIRAAGEPDFAPRARAVVKEIHSQVVPLIGGPLADFREPAAADLPPRARQVLCCLLEGDGDKQIAARLGMSRHTVGTYTRRIFIHFGVVGRTELMARWIRRGWGLPHREIPRE